MEVLISIGIMAIGMVSIASLLPVGSIQVERGNTEERKAELGLNAFREFQIRGMGDPTNWLDGVPWFQYGTRNPAKFEPVAIDPLILTGTDSTGKSNAGTSAIRNFPFNIATGTNVPVMKRLTVKAAAYNSGGGGAYTIQGYESLAAAIFTATDDLVVDQPDDRTLPATGHQMLDSSNKPIKRDYEGLYTWLATLTPNVGATSGNVPVAQLAMNQYVLSVVIFNRRQLRLPSPGSGQEEMVEVNNASPPAAGTVNIGGGDMTLGKSGTTTDAQLALAKPGTWMMLCRQDRDAANNVYSIFKWYRIISAADGSNSGTVDVTLNGPDWVWGAATGPNAYPTYACLFDGAVAVYQRVIHLDGPSVWSQ